MASEPNNNGNGNGSIAHQLEALERAIEDTVREGGANAIAVAEKGRRILGEARALAEDIARTSTAELASGATAAWHRARDVALDGAKAARETVRAHPLTVLGGVAAVSALTATVVTLMVQDQPRRRYRW
jgi:hypothetical protein